VKEKTEALIGRMLAGDRAALARLMTLVENREAETAEIMSRLHGHYGRAFVVGLTGPPGAGKSTLLDQIVGRLRRDGHRVGIVAVDPSSPFSGGAVLGDRIRMQSHFLDEGVFIRSLSARGSLGGLARASRDVARLLDAFGKDVIVVETVGVGQNEFDIMRVASTVIVALVPEAGDTIQAMKAGLLEIADIFVVNKADREGADRIKSELELMLQLRPANGWKVPVLLTTATQGGGLDELVRAIHEHRAHLELSGEGRRRAATGRHHEFIGLLRDELNRRLERGLVHGAGAAVLKQVERGEIDPYGAVRRLIDDSDALEELLREGGS
jgi:LAO/AO transport system kinase